MDSKESCECPGPESLADFHNVLFVCTSTKFSSWSSETGIWLEELAAPYFILKDAGYRIDFASIEGGAPPFDPGSIRPDIMEEYSQQLMIDRSCQDKIKDAKSIKDVVDDGSLEKYACVFLVGGHGCVDDFPHNQSITEAVEYIYTRNGGCVAAICHGSLGLLDARLANGKRLLDGKFCAVFSNEEEQQLGLDKFVPILTETAVDEAGAICVPTAPW